jgi:hypothetical protein
MRHHVCALVLAMGCASEAVSVDEAEIGGNGGGVPCPDWGCGINSPMLDNSFFHELNLDGIRNLEGYSLVGARKGLASYDLGVVNARLIARLRPGSVGATVLVGDALEGLQIALHRRDPATGTERDWTMSVDAVSRVVEFRAVPPGGATPPPIETYRFFVAPVGSAYGAFLCQYGELLYDDTGPRKMAQHTAVVYEGERINARRKYISPTLNNRWFNIGCAESAVAKLHLHGHTQAASAAGFSTTIAERQTMLKMLTGDYCGTGTPFTVAGQALDWEDDRHTMVLPLTIPKVTEARWTASGAACLETPRVLVNPTPETAAAFPDGVEAAIAAECPRPPRCPPIDTTYHLISYNRSFWRI